MGCRTLQTHTHKNQQSIDITSSTPKGQTALRAGSYSQSVWHNKARGYEKMTGQACDHPWPFWPLPSLSAASDWGLLPRTSLQNGHFCSFDPIHREDTATYLMFLILEATEMLHHWTTRYSNICWLESKPYSGQSEVQSSLRQQVCSEHVPGTEQDSADSGEPGENNTAYYQEHCQGNTPANAAVTESRGTWISKLTSLGYRLFSH